MNETDERYCMRSLGVCLASLVLFVMAVSASGAQEQKETRMDPVRAAGQAASGKDENDRPELQRRNPRYQLSRGDTIDLNFPFTPEFNQLVIVNPDGFITLMGVGDLYVTGKVVPELRQLLQTAYAKILHVPVINVVLKDFDKPYFIAGGEVGHPGKFDLRGDLTLTEAIAIAGGFSENSKHSQVLLFRRVSSDWAEVKVLNVKKMFQAGNLTEDVHLQPGDMFFVPQNRISKMRKWIPYTSLSTGFQPKL